MTDPLMMSTCCPLDSGDVVPVLRCGRRWLSEILPGTGVADLVTGFIRQRFLMVYGAEPALRIPGLLALTTGQGSLLAAVGVRDASRERLFLEDYLTVPVEDVMPRPGLSRHRIAEIAHLAGVEAGVSQYLFTTLALWLNAAGFEWVVCTGTGQLRNSFHRLGIDTQVLAEADPLRLPDQGAGWGRYYEHRPVVMAIHVQDTIAALEGTGLLRLARFLSAPNTRISSNGGRYGVIA